MKIIKVKITRKGGSNIYPNFNKIDSKIRKNLDWSQYIDTYGKGQMYDICGFGSIDHWNGNKDCIFSCLIVPKNFANEAIKMFPRLVSKMTEADFEYFYDHRLKKGTETEHIDTEKLQGILARVQLEKLGIAKAPSKQILEARSKCLDPDCDTHSGITKNKIKTWKQYKAESRITID